MNQEIEKRFETLKEFYPVYLSQHTNPICRLLHVVGTLTAMALTWLFIFQGNYLLIPFALMIAYGFAWVGHFVFEKNRPAAFKYPVYSFICDFLMLKDILSGDLKINFFKK
ncbi:MAG: DUF962 domain-containing protein [Bacteriovoracaceae bacterium]|nr:DUF962 domain-containing protein [Bacteriovoracaceae bacterium]